MEQKIASFQNKGMTRDISISKANNEFAFENHNVRIIARDNNTLLSITNERGNVSIPSIEIKGVLLGYAVLNKYVVLFIKEEDIDYIYRIEYKNSNTWNSIILFKGNLNFSINNPIETIINYESEDIQKVYWVDGINQPRFLNIKEENTIISINKIYTRYDFITTYNQNFKVEIEHSYQGSGLFSPGSIQYFFTYSNKFGQETNIINWSSMYYTGLDNRGAKSDESCNDIFKLTFKEYDNSFDYINIYSVQKTQTSRALYKLFSISIKDIVADKYIVDDNSSKISLNYNTLLYIGGTQIIAGTLSHKDNTLFLGDLKVEAINVIPELKEAINSTIQENGDSTLISFIKSTGLKGEYPYSIHFSKLEGLYPYSHDFNYPADNILTFKGGELYRFGIVFLTDKGTKSPVYWIGDKINDIYPEIDESNNCINRAVAVCNLSLLPNKAKQIIETNNYTSAILVRAEASFSDMLVQAQGIIEPTIFNIKHRTEKLIYSQPSWFSRPQYSDFTYKHLDQIKSSLSLEGEVQSSYVEHPPYYNKKEDYKILDKIFTVFYIIKDVSNSYSLSAVVLNKYKNKDKIEYTINTGVITSGSKMHSLSDCVYNVCSELRKQVSIYTNTSIINEDSILASLNHWSKTSEVKVLTDYSGFEILKDLGLSMEAAPAFIGNYPEENPEYLKALWIPEPYNGVTVNPIHYPFLYDLSQNFSDNLRYINSKNLENNYYIDSTFGNIFSPDITIDNLSLYNNKKYNLRIVGNAVVTGRLYDWNIDVDNKNLESAVVLGNYNLNNITKKVNNRAAVPGYYASKGSTASLWLLYPWHKEGSINNSTIPEGKTAKDVAELIKTKKSVNLLYCGITSYFNIESFNSLTYKDIVFKSAGQKGTSVIPFDYKDYVTTYYTEIDSVLTSGISLNGDIKKFPVVNTGENGLFVSPDNISNSDLFPGLETPLEDIPEYLKSKDVVKIKYTTNPHLVFNIPPINEGDNKGYLNTLPERTFGDASIKVIDTDDFYLWDDNKVQYVTPLFKVNTNYSEYPIILIGELYRERNGFEYGGKEESALESNVFLPISKITKITKNKIVGSTGDTYFQRYDCVRTLPLTNTDTNQNTSITSFMVETRSNIAGRCDIRRGWTSMVGINNENFNLMNSSYNTLPDSPTFNILDDKFSLQDFPSQITWSKSKIATEEIDTWTNITLSSILDLDGDKGPVRAIRRFQNSLIAFQDKGISEILFNSRTQLSTQQGIPIEIGNSGKVEGKRYITNKAGCINKWSIVETKNGIYFIDNINSSISLFNGKVNSLSDTKGFKAWIGKNNSINIWNPKEFNNFIGYWDRLNDDIYFVNKDTALCYNELLQQFTSFFDYNEIPMMVNVEDKFISFKDSKLWIQNEGNYNELFGEYKPFYIKYKITPDPYGDKTFSTLEYRADMFDMDNNSQLTNNTFDTLKVENEYQENTISVKDIKFPLYSSSIKDKYPDVRRKFRIWRMDIPRDRKNINNPYGLNRIRNPWIYLKLSKTPTLSNERMEFHDLAVRYFE